MVNIFVIVNCFSDISLDVRTHKVQGLNRSFFVIAKFGSRSCKTLHNLHSLVHIQRAIASIST